MATSLIYQRLAFGNIKQHRAHVRYGCLACLPHDRGHAVHDFRRVVPVRFRRRGISTAYSQCGVSLNDMCVSFGFNVLFNFHIYINFVNKCKEFMHKKMYYNNTGTSEISPSDCLSYYSSCWRSCNGSWPFLGLQWTPPLAPRTTHSILQLLAAPCCSMRCSHHRVLLRCRYCL